MEDAKRNGTFAAVIVAALFWTVGMLCGGANGACAMCILAFACGALFGCAIYSLVPPDAHQISHEPFLKSCDLEDRTRVEAAGDAHVLTLGRRSDPAA